MVMGRGQLSVMIKGQYKEMISEVWGGLCPPSLVIVVSDTTSKISHLNFTGLLSDTYILSLHRSPDHDARLTLSGYNQQTVTFACVITGLCPWLDHWSMIWPIVMRCDPIKILCTCYQITIHVIMWISSCYQVNQYTQDQSTGSKTSGSMHDWPHREIISMYFNE